ncbi:Uu.00g109610.m01.CDS01 [Anthostomella pinea]|uniref:Uu.00g109610.m01.CDS01 n=1 Tax=Anthostomella pinea TaxID=933095 RepID=A0AAI8YDS3_9PEZI|nr:Uu.00g109610.m01.CDS01 [Anthostomella pinea]
MQIFAILSSAAVASAAVMAKRDIIFKVSDFSAGCVAHSTQCLYYFNVTQPGSPGAPDVPVTCKALVTANNDGTLPDVDDGTCLESARTWTALHADAGITLALSQQVSPASYETGSHLLASNEFTISNETNAKVQSYTGPTAFDLVD